MAEQLEAFGSPAKGTANVLVVNMDLHFGAAVACYLEARGWPVWHATNVRETLERWGAFGPQLVITDLEGAEMDGFEFLEALASLPVRPAVLVCVPPAASAQVEGGALGQLGVHGVIARPCRLGAIEGQLASLLRVGACAIDDGTPSAPELQIDSRAPLPAKYRGRLLPARGFLATGERPVQALPSSSRREHR